MSEEYQKSPVTEASEIYRQRAEAGDNLLEMDAHGAINWSYEGTSCQAVLPSDETDGVGLLQTIRYTDEEKHEIARYYFTSDGLLDVLKVLVTKEELDVMTREMLDTFMDMVQLDDFQPSDDDMQEFFTLFFSPFRDSNTQ